MSNEDNASIINTLWQEMRSASLATIDVGGVPHVSLVTIVPFNKSVAVLLLSKLARHTANLERDKRCSLLIVGEENEQSDILAGNRVTVTGNIRLADVPDVSAMKGRFLLSHPEAANYVDFADFSFYRFESEQFHLVGGFGRIETIPAGRVF